MSDYRALDITLNTRKKNSRELGWGNSIASPLLLKKTNKKQGEQKWLRHIHNFTTHYLL